MRIAHVVNEFLPTSQTFVYTQLQAQLDLQQIVLARRTLNRSTFPFAPVWELSPFDHQVERSASRLRSRLPSLGARLDPLPRKIDGPLRRFGVELVHAHFGWRGRESVAACRRLGLPLVTALHGRDVYSPRHALGGIRNYYDELFATGSVFTCVGPRARRELTQNGCPPDRLEIVPVGLDLSQFPFEPARRNGTIKFLQVGRLVAKKGFDTTLHAFAEARRVIGDAHLSVVGDGPDRDALMRLADDLKISRHVRFHGSLLPQAVRDLMGRAHIGLQPSRVGADGDREGSPTTIIEMQARGVDIVATDHSDISFIVPDPDRLVPEGDADGLAAEMVKRATATDDDREQRLQAGRQLVEAQHDATLIARQLRALYQRAVNDPRGA